MSNDVPTRQPLLENPEANPQSVALLKKHFSIIQKRALRSYKKNMRFEKICSKKTMQAARRAEKAFAVFKVASVSLSLVEKAEQKIPLTAGEMAFLNSENIEDAIKVHELLNSEMSENGEGEADTRNETPHFNCNASMEQQSNECAEDGDCDEYIGPSVRRNQITESDKIARKNVLKKIAETKKYPHLEMRCAERVVVVDDNEDGECVGMHQLHQELDTDNYGHSFGNFESSQNPPFEGSQNPPFNDPLLRPPLHESAKDMRGMNSVMCEHGVPYPIPNRRSQPAPVSTTPMIDTSHPPPDFAPTNFNFHPKVSKHVPEINISEKISSVQLIKIGRRVHPSTTYDPPQVYPLYPEHVSGDEPVLCSAQGPPAYLEATLIEPTSEAQNINVGAPSHAIRNPLLSNNHLRDIGVVGVNGTHGCTHCTSDVLMQAGEFPTTHVVSHSEINGGATINRIKIACGRKGIEEKIEELENEAIMNDEVPDGRFIDIHSSINNFKTCLMNNQCRTAAQKQKLQIRYASTDGKKFYLRCQGQCLAPRMHILGLLCSECGNIENVRFPPNNLNHTKMIIGKLDLLESSEREENPVTQLQLPTEYFFQMINNATVSVDTFFVMSGFLLTYLFLKRMKSTKGAQLKSPKFWIMYYVHRYIRLTPVYMIVILLGYAFWDYLGVGPMWAGRDESIVLKYCPSSWWHNALYINNLFKFGEQCIGWTWYLANDMQFYWISPPLLLALYYQPRFALGAIGLLIAASDFVRGYVTVEEGFPPTVTVSVKPLKWANPDFAEEVYQRPYMRISTYLVGVLLGWLLYARDGRNNGPTRGWALLSWVATFVLSELVLFGMFNFARTGDIDVTTRAIYASLFRTAWGVAVAATIYLCVKGAGGPINSFLSWNMWFPLSRLTYCTYLLHEFVLIYIYSTLRSPEYGCHYQSVYVFLSALVMTTALALVFSLAFEAPVMALEKLVFERPKPPAERRVSERHDGGQSAAAQPSAPAPQPPHADV